MLFVCDIIYLRIMTKPVTYFCYLLIFYVNEDYFLTPFSFLR